MSKKQHRECGLLDLTKPYIALVDIGVKWGRNPNVFWTWEGWIDANHCILTDDVRDCLKYFHQHHKLLPKPVKGTFEPMVKAKKRGEKNG